MCWRMSHSGLASLTHGNSLHRLLWPRRARSLRASDTRGPGCLVPPHSSAVLLLLGKGRGEHLGTSSALSLTSPHPLCPPLMAVLSLPNTFLLRTAPASSFTQRAPGLLPLTLWPPPPTQPGSSSEKASDGTAPHHGCSCWPSYTAQRQWRTRSQAGAHAAGCTRTSFQLTGVRATASVSG